MTERDSALQRRRELSQLMARMLRERGVIGTEFDKLADYKDPPELVSRAEFEPDDDAF